MMTYVVPIRAYDYHFYSRTITSFSPLFFFFNDTATTEIYTLSLHDALPISPRRAAAARGGPPWSSRTARRPACRPPPDRKSTRLNSSHTVISYAVFCLKKKNEKPRSFKHALHQQESVAAQCLHSDQIDLQLI